MATEVSNAEPAGYDRLLNISASAVTVAAGVLGVFGIGTGIVTALLRNAPEAALTSTCVAGVAVLAGLASALVRTDLTVRNGPRGVRGGLAAAGVLAAVMWALVGWAYQQNGARTTFNAWAWYAFIGGIAAGTIAAIAWVTRRSRLRLRTGLALTGVFLFGSAVLAMVVLATATLRTTGRPTIALEVTPAKEPAGYVTLAGKITAQGLSNDERYEIKARLLPDPATLNGGTEIFRAYVGPDRDGAVSYPFTVSFVPETGRSWIGVTARVIGEGRADQEPADGCASPAEPGVNCTLVLAPAGVAPTPTG
ncbi:hypothetical protein ACFQFC_10455 [Amorphoplanes digitatis]|uniref:Uncharacterized protein n=1 Tax=Actinoplanes digitatis TaxID=1868 RepID=A0A7W7MRT1_9ACTN|nr:hypothetical protein [Actinoplanes digitatis]MBB4764618.1 hypothetical protein [Actinoplanes digitatis]GID91431.1 hypothetical protein Adi01nite_08430 [Actinoplanes digitatis]